MNHLTTLIFTLVITSVFSQNSQVFDFNNTNSEESRISIFDKEENIVQLSTKKENGILYTVITKYDPSYNIKFSSVLDEIYPTSYAYDSTSYPNSMGVSIIEEEEFYTVCSYVLNTGITSYINVLIHPILATPRYELRMSKILKDNGQIVFDRIIHIEDKHFKPLVIEHTEEGYIVAGISKVLYKQYGCMIGYSSTYREFENQSNGELLVLKLNKEFDPIKMVDLKISGCPRDMTINNNEECFIVGSVSDSSDEDIMVLKLNNDLSHCSIKTLKYNNLSDEATTIAMNPNGKHFTVGFNYERMSYSGSSLQECGIFNITNDLDVYNIRSLNAIEMLSQNRAIHDIVFLVEEENKVLLSGYERHESIKTSSNYCYTTTYPFEHIPFVYKLDVDSKLDVDFLSFYPSNNGIKNSNSITIQRLLVDTKQDIYRLVNPVFTNNSKMPKNIRDLEISSYDGYNNCTYSPCYGFLQALYLTETFSSSDPINIDVILEDVDQGYIENEIYNFSCNYKPKKSLTNNINPSAEIENISNNNHFSFDINLANESNSLEIKVINISGKTIYKKKVKEGLTKGYNTIHLDKINTAKGIYYIIINSNSNQYIGKVFLN